MEYKIPFPKKIKIVSEDDFEGVYEIEGLFPGYGYTIGHSLRRIILSSMPGAAVTKIKIEGVSHEFSTIEGVKEDVINIILNIKQIRFKKYDEEPQIFTTIIKGPAKFTAGNLKVPTGLEVVNKDLHIATLTTKDSVLEIDMTVENGLGYVPKEELQREKMEVGAIALDAIFSPIRKVNYEVENMRVQDKTDYNRLKFTIESDGTIKPYDILETSVKILINQFKALLEEMSDEEIDMDEFEGEENTASVKSEVKDEEDVLKIRIEDLDFSTRTLNSLSGNGIRTVGGLVKKREADLLNLEGLGAKALKEIRRSLGKLGLSFKE